MKEQHRFVREEALR